MTGRWVFGYGSLVSTVSFGHTLGRDLTPGVDFFEAEIAGYGRRWNYGTDYRFTSIDDRDPEPKRWTFVALGLVHADEESTNGVIAWVTDEELVALDARERNYDRVDVTGRARLGDEARTAARDATIVTYVPRSEPIARYEAAKQRRDAAITRRYWDLVDGAFADLGEGRRERYHATTPAPDIPVIDQPEHEVVQRHRGRAR
jgi:cation transport regulator ChaC